MTTNCVLFYNAIQGLIEKGTLKFLEKGKEVIGVDRNLFPTIEGEYDSSRYIEVDLSSS